jgi:hypothetical protein
MYTLSRKWLRVGADFVEKGVTCSKMSVGNILGTQITAINYEALKGANKSAVGQFQKNI